MTKAGYERIKIFRLGEVSAIGHSRFIANHLILWANQHAIC